MAEKDAKLPDNADGPFYVDENCSDSGVCRDIAPHFFGHNRAAGYSFVAKQPASDEERAICQKALKACPLGAIGDDGA
jgi:ferredoxin